LQTVEYYYNWTDGETGALLQGPLTESAGGRNFDCAPAAHNCHVGQNFIVYVDVCDSHSPPACTRSLPSSRAYVTGTFVPPAYGNASAAIREFEIGGPQTPFESGNPFYDVGWFSDWRAMGFIAVMVSALIVALAYMFGVGFGLREVKLWADIELAQVVGSAMIIVALIGFMVFVDFMANIIADATMRQIAPAGLGCSGATDIKPCAMRAAGVYLDQLQSVAREAAKNSLKSSVDAAFAASRRVGVITSSVYTLWAGGSYAPNAGVSMRVDKENAIFDYYAKIMASLEAQRYFLDVVTYGVAPALLLFGILARTFFFTRKLGGLLLAIAVALLIIYPLTYVFSWLTLYVSVYGTNAFAPQGYCPAECKIGPPLAFFYNNNNELMLVNTPRDAVDMGIDASTYATLVNFTTCDNMGEFGIPNTIDGVPNTLTACEGCIPGCRELPYPFGNGACNENDCSKCDARCKVVRGRPDCSDNTNVNFCPLNTGTENDCQPECRVKIPMEGGAYHNYLTGANVPATRNPSDDVCLGCVGCPMNCRYLECTNPSTCNTPNTAESPECGAAACQLSACPAECRYVMNIVATGDCDSLCKDTAGLSCPKACRINIDPGSELDTDNFMQNVCDSAQNHEACTRCPPACKATPIAAGTSACAEPPTRSTPVHTNCKGCPEYCRWDDASFSFGLCSQSGSVDYCSDTNCDPACKIDNLPTICAAYGDTQPNHGDDTGWFSNVPAPTADPVPCSACPNDCRYRMRYVEVGVGGFVEHYLGPPSGCDPVACATDPPTAGGCPEVCMNPVLKMPNDLVNCLPYDTGPMIPIPLDGCKKCPYECRVSDWRSRPACDIAECAPAPYPPAIPAPPSDAANATYSLSGTSADAAPNVAYSLAGGGIPLPLPPPACPDTCKVDNTNIQPLICSPYYSYWSVVTFGNRLVPPAAGPPYTWDDVPQRIPIGSRITDSTLPASVDFNTVEYCKQCPAPCRISNIDTHNCDSEMQYVDCSGASCPEPPPIFTSACRQPLPPPPASSPPYCDDYQGRKECFDCPAHCLMQISPGDMPSGYCTQAGCSTVKCTDACKAAVPKEPCKGCFKCDPDCVQIPPVRTNCGDLCEQSELTGLSTITPSAFLTAAGGENSGDPETKAVGLLLIPAMILPLFNIVIVISFVRALSPVLGGDIEIPGIARLI
jgi:hypothetical protein